MTTVLIEKKFRTRSNSLRKTQVSCDLDSTPLPVPEDELVSLDEFRVYMEDLARERLGITLKL